MAEQFWFDTEAYPDRRERRMAECLAHGSVSWEAILFVGTKSQTVADEVVAGLDAATSTPRVAVRRGWYF